ncbi:unnamed protein product [Brachionus calyciflorus]|uniref:EF-hand domain-containing protein n=1 Tax=Brachionus calyciflorus TaxID=104777 RepID=A0A813SZ05_9BILA|nr:unnamed protein product [Brachionus calyciflorus]
MNELKLKEYKEVFSMFDKNKDGVITSCEVGEVLESFESNKDEQDEELQAAFKIFDLDGTGRISKSELKSALVNLGENINDKNLNLIIETIDLDGDGFISFEEFKKFVCP